MKLRGKAYWARVQEGNFDEFGGREFYKITVALDDESWVKFNKSGLGLQPKPVSKDDEDTIGVTFRRDVSAKTGVDKRGKKWSIGGGAPKVTLDGEEFDGLIGNGSLVEVVVETYDTKIKKKGHRLEKVNIIDLVKYEAPDDDDDDDEPPVRKAPAKKHVVEEDDEPPFDTDEDEAPKKKKKLAF